MRYTLRASFLEENYIKAKRSLFFSYGALFLAIWSLTPYVPFYLLAAASLAILAMAFYFYTVMLVVHDRAIEFVTLKGSEKIQVRDIRDIKSNFWGTYLIMKDLRRVYAPVGLPPHTVKALFKRIENSKVRAAYESSIHFEPIQIGR